MGLDTDRNRGGVKAAGGVFVEQRDSFTRPADTTAYGIGDVLSATTSNTGTTALRGLELARTNGGSGYITSWAVTVNHTTFLPRIRVHLYTVAAPTTALNGDNGAFVELDANVPEWVASFDLPNFVLSAGAGADMVRAVRDDLRIPFKCATTDSYLYYRYEVLDAATPASGKTVRTVVRADIN